MPLILFQMVESSKSYLLWSLYLQYFALQTKLKGNNLLSRRDTKLIICSYIDPHENTLVGSFSPAIPLDHLPPYHVWPCPL